jgi:VWFA-related protein
LALALYNGASLIAKENMMMSQQRLHVSLLSTILVVGFALIGERAFGQSPTESDVSAAGIPGKPVTIPLTIRLKEALPETELQNIDLTVSEDGEPRTVISIRAMVTNSPISLAILIQDDLVPPVGNEIKSLAEFVRKLPRGSRVMVGYVRSGSLQVKQKFTTDLEKAAKALRPPIGFASAGPFNPYVEVIEAVKRFESQPAGRRAILLVSDGLDISRGIDSSSPTQSLDLQRAINEAQRRSVAVYGFYAPTGSSQSSSILGANAQSSLLRLATETGGHAFFQGTGAAVSFEPFIRELDQILERQVALTFLSTHLKKGFHRIEVRSSTPGVRIAFPAGYMR